MKRDIHRHKERWTRWKARATSEGIAGVSEANTNLILQYLRDMELGVNIGVGSVKGPRTPARLNILRERMVFFAKQFQGRFAVDDLRNVTEDQLLMFFVDLRDGTITTAQGRPYQSLDTLTNIFKAFWHWHERSSRKQGTTVPDITADLPSYSVKPKWVYLTESQMTTLLDAARVDYRTLFSFIYDSGIRPSELVHLRCWDLYDSCKELEIRSEIAKKGSFGRRIKLMLCTDSLRKQVERSSLQPDDFLFSFKPASANKYLKRLVVGLFGNGLSPAGKRYGQISLYDLRHNACCYWLPRYKSESALLYRFGWKRSEMIHYYSELLGMRDTIAEEDLLVDAGKTELERRLIAVERENQLLTDKLQAMNESLRTVNQLSRELKDAALSLSRDRQDAHVLT